MKAQQFVSIASITDEHITSSTWWVTDEQACELRAVLGIFGATPASERIDLVSPLDVASIDVDGPNTIIIDSNPTSG